MTSEILYKYLNDNFRYILIISRNIFQVLISAKLIIKKKKCRTPVFIIELNTYKYCGNKVLVTCATKQRALHIVGEFCSVQSRDQNSRPETLMSESCTIAAVMHEIHGRGHLEGCLKCFENCKVQCKWTLSYIFLPYTYDVINILLQSIFLYIKSLPLLPDDRDFH